MLSRGVIATHGQTVRRGFRTDSKALLTLLNALLHGFGRVMWHGDTLPVVWCGRGGTRQDERSRAAPRHVDAGKDSDRMFSESGGAAL